MKKQTLYFLFIVIVFCSVFSQATKAQTIELLGGNTLNGAVNGVVLGGATMALQNSNDFAPVRVGLGAGTLYGIGMGVYDLSQISKGQQYYIAGTFNDGLNSSILVLLDTFYGAAGGALIASSISLIIKAPFGKAVQYGAGAGAWTGFGFGLFDAFVLAQGPDFSSPSANKGSNGGSGLITYSSANHSLEMGLINPVLLQQKELTKKSLKTVYQPSVHLLDLKINF